MAAHRFWRPAILLGLFLLGLSVAGNYSYGLFGDSSKQEQEKARPAAAGVGLQPTEAQWRNLKTEPVRLVSFAAEHQADGRIAINDYKTTPVFSPYSGRVTRCFAEAGAAVAQGNPLYAIEATEFVQAQNDLTTAINGRNKAQAQYRVTQINEGRQRDMFAAKAAAKRDWEQSEADFVAASNDLKTAEIGIEAVRKRLRILGKSEKEIDELTTRGGQINPEAIVGAPISGTVIQRKVNAGQYIQSAANDPVFTIGDLSNVWLVAHLHEMDIPFVHLGAVLKTSVLAFPDKPLLAKVVYIAPMVDAASRRLTVRAEIQNPGLALKPEMFASFTIISGDPQPHPAVPQSAIIYEGSEAHVWVVQKDRRISSRKVVLGQAAGNMIEVRSGLTAGEEAVTSGALFIDRASQPGSSENEKQTGERPG
ncbi:MAG: efflux RND transporter periplasmic adaptor subunit [Rhodomicrobium sp.]